MFYVYLNMQLIQTVLLIYTAVSLHICMSFGDEEGWTLVYKIATGGNGSAYDLFMSNDSLNVNDKEAMSLNCSKNPLKKHFKSDIVNYWSIIGIHQVRVSVYVNGIEQVFLLFNGSETNKTNWFNKSRLINSSYSDLNEQTNFTSFSVYGINGSATNTHYTGFYSRRFYIRDKTHPGECDSSDFGWLLVGDEQGNCKYERNIKDKPFILFSNPPNMSKAKNHALADSFAIFIKFSSKANCLSQFVMNCVYGNSQCITNATQTSTKVAETSSTNPVQTSPKSPAPMSSTNPVQTPSTKSPAPMSSTNPVQTPSKKSPAPMSSTNPVQTPSTKSPAPMSSTNPVQTPSTKSPAPMSSTNPVQTPSTKPTQTSPTNPAQTSSTSSTIRSEDLQNKIDKIRMELTVQRKSTQKYKRSLTSAPDERTSSKLMGIIGGTFIASVIGLIVLLDCATCNMGRKGTAKKGATKHN